MAAGVNWERLLKLEGLAPSSSGPGRLAFIQEIAGSIPAGVTNGKERSYTSPFLFHEWDEKFMVSEVEPNPTWVTFRN